MSDPTTPTMRFYRHSGDGQICWTNPGVDLHYRAPRPGEHPGHQHCAYRHDNPQHLTELTDTHARTLLNPTTGRDNLINRIHNTIDFDHIELFPGEDEPGYPNPRSLSVSIADALITSGITLPTP